MVINIMNHLNQITDKRHAVTPDGTRIAKHCIHRHWLRWYHARLFLGLIAKQCFVHRVIIFRRQRALRGAGMLERLFQLKAHNTNVRTEVLAGVTTFLAMAYILFVNPSILGSTGMDKGAVFVATCLAAAIGSTIMGLIANYPIALAPGMGLNAFFTYTVVLHMGHTWQVALGAVFISAVCFFLLSIFRIREWIVNSIPLPLRSAIAAGIGLFLALIALQNAGIVVDNPATLVGLGDLTQPGAILAVLGFILIVALEARKVRGAVLIGILAVTLVSILFKFSPFGGLVSMPPSLAPTFLQLDLAGALNIGLVSVIFAFLFVDLFDNSGTLIGVAKRAGLMGKDGHMPKMGRALIADSTAAMAGSLLGTSTTTSYIESAAGVSAGGRTGLTAVVVAVLFLLALFFSPLAGSVPAYATAPALMFVAVLMTSGLAEINWDDITEAAPVVVTALAMPLTYSIANGIAFGFIAWTAMKLASGRLRDLNPALIILSVLFVIKLGWFNA
jgi:AGZA family xanthine/uracil permease-like MFS transporter